MTRHLLGLHQGEPGARVFRRHLSTHATRPGATIAVWDTALAHLAPSSHRAERTGTGP